ncbi:MAG: hypothetical protein K2M06_02645 [Muribaculaceae bacterium]|nr:hypothetical protein [Muribaculaceae bacterium]
MSKASASTTLTVLPDLGTFNPYLLCNKGDLWQNYTGAASAPSKVTPDFTVTKPVVSLFVTSSRSNGQETPDEVKFYLGDVLIGTITRTGASYTKTANTSAAVSGLFDLLSPLENNGCYGLRIKQNLVAATNGENGQIRAAFEVSQGTSFTTLHAACPFTLSEVVENSSIVVIEAGDNRNFQLTQNNTSCILAAKFYRGLTLITSGITYKWYKQEFGANPTGGALANWKLLTGATGPNLTVNAADVDSSQRYMVQVLDAAGNVLGQDTQMVFDTSDFYEVGISRNPESGQPVKGGSVLVTAEVFRRGNSTPLVLTSPVWSFVGVTPAGTTICQSVPGPSNSYSVSEADIKAAGGQLELTVTVDF